MIYYGIEIKGGNKMVRLIGLKQDLEKAIAEMDGWEIKRLSNKITEIENEMPSEKEMIEMARYYGQ